MRPKIILATGLNIDAPPGSIVINYRHGYFLKDGIEVPQPHSHRNNRSQRFRVMAGLLCVQDKISCAEFTQAIWGDSPCGGPLDPFNYVSVLVHNFEFRHPVTRMRLSVRAWLGFKVRSYYDKHFHVLWPEQTRVEHMVDNLHPREGAGDLAVGAG